MNVFLERKLLRQLKKHLNLPEISLILGPRQAGKTTLMLKLQEELKSKGKTTCYFNLDVIEDRQYFSTQHNLLDRIEKLVGLKKSVVFIDEIQRLENAGLFLKGLYDLRPACKFVVSGSGSLELKANIIEPLTGRKKIFFCLPLDFTEFAAYKLKCPFEKVSQKLDSNPFESERLRREYYVWGGYPRVVLASTEEEKKEILEEIYQSYLEKDIQLFLRVEKEQAFENLLKVLASRPGGLVNRAELASLIGVQTKTVDRYLFWLEKTFIISLVRPFYANVRKELTKMPKVYFLDLGFLRRLQGGQVETGAFFENACFLRLKELNLNEPIKFWRTLAGAEVDFVLFAAGQMIPVEVKFVPKTLGKSLFNFLVKYQSKKAFIYNWKIAKSIKKFGCQIIYLPYQQLPSP